MGQTERALEMVRSLEQEAERRYVGPFLISWVYAALGDRDAMLSWLDRAYKNGDLFVFFSLGLEEFDPYRGDPGFQDMLSRFALAGYPWVENSLRVE